MPEPAVDLDDDPDPFVGAVATPTSRHDLLAHAGGQAVRLLDIAHVAHLGNALELVDVTERAGEEGVVRLRGPRGQGVEQPIRRREAQLARAGRVAHRPVEGVALREVEHGVLDEN